MFEGLLKSKFYNRSKAAIKMTKTRIEMIKRKRNATQKFLKNDIADLLKNGLDVNAYGRVEGLWNEMNFSSCYDFVEQFCTHLSNHLTAMNRQSECPEECREAASSLIFAAARFADLPELRNLRNLFMERYGSSIECYANKEFVEKLKSSPPTKDMKLRLMQDIATESGVEWSTKSLEQKLFNPPATGQEYNKKGNAGGRNPLEMFEAVESTDVKAAACKHEDPGRYGSLAMEVAYLSSYGRKEPSREESSLSTRRKPFGEGNNESEAGIMSTKDNEVDKPGLKLQHHEAQDMESASGEEEYDSKPFCYKGIRPPYYKSKITNRRDNITEPFSCTKGSEHKNANGHAFREVLPHQGDPVDEAKSKPKSVRRRNQKPQPGQEKIDSSEPENDEKQSRRWWKASKDSNDDHWEAEEKSMDRLLLHFSRKKPSNTGKLKSVLEPSHCQTAFDRDCDQKNINKEGLRIRTPSLPVELTQVDASKGHARARSLQPEILNSSGHVHPKLPDYDDFVAQLAAVRGNLK